MTSDNWNFLANLLGTPEPADPPSEKETKDEATADQPIADNTDESGEGLNKPVADSESSNRSPSSLPEGDEVLEALTSVTPPPSLPGFGVREADPDLEDLAGQVESDGPDAAELLGRLDSVGDEQSDDAFDSAGTVAGQEDDESESESDEEPDEEPETLAAAWSELANELGVDPDAAPPPRPTTESSIGAHAERAETKEKETRCWFWTWSWH